MKKERHFNKESGKRETCVGKENKLSTKELAAFLLSKKQNLSSDKCRCGAKKAPGFERCYPCFKRSQENMTWGEKNQAAQKRKYSPNRKNRRKSEIIDQYLYPLDKISKPNEEQYRMKAKTILRKAFNPLSALSEDLNKEEVTESILNDLESFE